MNLPKAVGTCRPISNRFGSMIAISSVWTWSSRLSASIEEKLIRSSLSASRHIPILMGIFRPPKVRRRARRVTACRVRPCYHPASSRQGTGR